MNLRRPFRNLKDFFLKLIDNITNIVLKRGVSEGVRELFRSAKNETMQKTGTMKEPMELPEIDDCLSLELEQSIESLPHSLSLLAVGEVTANEFILQ